jgi:hypothetical protein
MRVLRQILAALNPLELWRALREAEDGVCLMAAPVRVERQRRR